MINEKTNDPESCFPVVTIGASFAALYDSTFRGFRRGEKNTWQRFAAVCRENWKSGIAPTVVFLLALANMPGTIALGMLNVLTALIGSLFIEPMFRPYMPKEEDAA